MGLMEERSILDNLMTVSGAMTAVVIVLTIFAVYMIHNIVGVSVFSIGSTVVKTIIRLLSKFIYRKEKKYHRDITIGKVSEKNRSVKIYRFLNDLIIDLEIKEKGATPYEFLVLLLLGSAFVSLVGSQIIMNNIIMGIVLFPIIFAGITCALYTKANIAHDARIEAIIEAENIVSNNIKDGVVVAVRNSIDMIPQMIRDDFVSFLDNVEHENYHIKTALLNLNNNLGSTADDFIKKCIEFELAEEHGIAGMFKDIVEINNIKMDMRTEMKRKFEKVSSEFIMGALMIFIFLGGVIAVFPNVRHFYFRTVLGQIIIAIDMLIMIGEFVYITYLRAKDL